MARPPHHPIDSLSVARRRACAAAAAAFAMFATWGSWFPFVIRPVPFDVAVEVLRDSATPRLLSISDALSNLLLFVPIGFFATPVIVRRSGWPRGIAVIALSAALSLLLELGQLLVPWRTPSVLDIAAETMGATAGALLWHLAASEIERRTNALIAAWRAAGRIARLLWLYTAAFSLAWLLPFDFTIRPLEIADKYSHKRLLLPWMPSPDAAAASELWLIAIAAIPLGWAAVIWTGNGQTRGAALTATALIAAALLALTLLQITVFSRTTDTTTTLAAIGGAATAAALMGARLSAVPPTLV